MVMIRTIIRLLSLKAVWCCGLIAATCGILFYQHSYRACAELAVFVMVGLLAVFEDYNDPTAETVVKCDLVKITRTP